MRYVVTGNHAVFGAEHGETFEMDLDPVTEARLVSGGHIARADQVKEPAKNAQNDGNDNEDGEERGSPLGA